MPIWRLVWAGVGGGGLLLGGVVEVGDSVPVETEETVGLHILMEFITNCFNEPRSFVLVCSTLLLHFLLCQ